MGKVKGIQSELTLHKFLHKKGYNYFNIPKLTPKEITQLIDGELIK